MFATGRPWPTEAVPFTATVPGGSTAPLAGLLIATVMLVPPGRLPFVALALVLPARTTSSAATRSSTGPVWDHHPGRQRSLDVHKVKGAFMKPFSFALSNYYTSPTSYGVPACYRSRHGHVRRSIVDHLPLPPCADAHAAHNCQPLCGAVSSGRPSPRSLLAQAHPLARFRAGQQSCI